MLDKVTFKKFEKIVGSQAVLTVLDGPDINLTVEEVHTNTLKDDDDRPEDCRKDPFSVLLSGPVSNQAPDGTYAVSFDTIGVLEGLYVDNKADNPECEKFNTAKEAGDAPVAEAEKLAPGAAPPPEPEKSVLYEIVFG